jgi:hypothetical protein
MVIVYWMRFPLFSIQEMTNDFPPNLLLLKEWISPKGLREISITFLLVGQPVTEMGKETGQYFKAKTYKCDSKYYTSVLLYCLVPKQILCPAMYFLPYLLSNSSEVGPFRIYFWVTPHQDNCIHWASQRKSTPMTWPTAHWVMWSWMTTGQIA